MPRGGRRTGAGRPKGSPDKIKREKEIAASGLTPLDYMLSVLRDSKATPENRKWAAGAAAPYCHPRLSSVDHTGALNLKHEDVTPEQVREEVSTLFAEPADDASDGDKVVH